jgi:hypothetical protein
MWGVVVTACVVFSFLNKPADSWNVDWNAYVLHPLLEPFSVILASPEQYKIECLTYDSLIKMPLVCVYLKDLPSFNVCVFFFFLVSCCRYAQAMVDVSSMYVCVFLCAAAGVPRTWWRCLRISGSTLSPTHAHFS